jgi:nucleotide-binding universal stress UspA family protein
MTQDSSVSRSQDSSVRAVGGTAPLIVVGLDGSSTSWDAFSWAVGEAIRSNGSLVAVYVTPEVEPVAAFGVPLSYAAVEQARDEVAGELKDEAEHRARDLGVHLRFVRGRGDTAPALARIARSLGADLIVVGRSAKMLHHLAGSLGRRLVSRHDAPVIVVVP